MANANLSKAKTAKQDEFYTQYADIEKEVNAYLEYRPDTFRDKVVLLPCDDPEWSNFTRYFALHFEDLGLRRLVSTSYAPESKKLKMPLQLSLFETESPQFDPAKTQTHGKIFVLDRDVDGNGRTDIDDLQWHYLESDGDFRSKEITALRDDADIIVTNPPFSLFREFFGWIMEGEKDFLIIGNMNAVTYKEVFPCFKDNLVWYGCTINSGDREFGVPDAYPLDASGWRIDEEGKKFIRVKGVRWFTNLDHGRRHQPLSLMTMADNLKFSKHKELKGKDSYDHYDNYNAIEVPFTDAIPSDYDGAMGVPITFLDKYCPEQFDIIDIAKRGPGKWETRSKIYTAEDYPNYNDLNATPVIIEDGVPRNTYPRILIRKKQ